MKNLTAGIASLLIISTATPATANNISQLFSRSWCNDTLNIYKNSWEQFEETPLFVGQGVIDILLTDGTISPELGAFTVYVNQDTGTFAATMTFEDNMTCVLTAGSNFTPYTGPKPERPRN